MNKRLNQTPSTNILSESISLDFQKELKHQTTKKENNINNKGIQKSKKNRKINSLEELSKKVIKYALESKSRLINLSLMAKTIKVNRRRIYDIMNVLEGN